MSEPSAAYADDGLTIRDALRYVRECLLRDYGIDTDLSTRAEIEWSLRRLAGEQYLEGYMSHVSLDWHNHDNPKDGTR